MEVNSNVIVRRIDRSCDILGGIDELKSRGFYNIMGYVEIIKEINNKSFDEVLNIMKGLISDGSIYSEFAVHILTGGMLHDKFFELDENFNPTKNNLNYYFNNSLDEDDSMSSPYLGEYSAEDSLKDEINSLEKEAKRLYESNTQSSSSLSMNLNADSLSKAESLKEKINPEVTRWIEDNVKNMTNEDYGNFMVYIASNRNK